MESLSTPHQRYTVSSGIDIQNDKVERLHRRTQAEEQQVGDGSTSLSEREATENQKPGELLKNENIKGLFGKKCCFVEMLAT